MDAETIAEQVRMCAACPKMCRHVCPTFFAWRSDGPTPHGRALLIHQDGIGARDLDERGVEVLYQCLQCSHCLTWCVPEIDIAQIVEATRERLVNEGKYPSGLDEMQESILKNHNPFNEDHSKRNSWLTSSGGGSKKIVYFSGCTASYREQSISEATVETLESLDYEVIVSPDEWCCGSPLLRTGFRDAAIEQAKHNVEILNAIDADEIVTPCPGCYKTLVNDYSAHGLELNKPVRHISQKLAESLHAVAGIKTKERITFHDPCHLGRHIGEYDAPRKVIRKAAGVSPIEMERTRENAKCCGNGAGLRTLFPEQARKIGSSRIDDAKDIEADIIVTSCPFCKNMLKQQTDESIRVLDLPEFVQEFRNSS
ncbi:MAG: (Fe-S)-binding protein [Candidatus Thorarchaeota archaeon]|jgi:heterodisulfide reductase subunit D